MIQDESGDICSVGTNNLFQIYFSLRSLLDIVLRLIHSGPVAQLVEHSPEERGVTSSNLVWATIIIFQTTSYTSGSVFAKS